VKWHVSLELKVTLDKSNSLWRARLDGDIEGSGMADSTRHLGVDRLDHTTVLNLLANVKDSASHGTGDEDRGISKVETRADTTTETEAHITRILFRVRTQETLWIEDIWVLVCTRVSEHEINVGKHGGTLGNEETILNVILSGDMWDGGRDYRVEAKNFLGQRICVWQMFSVGEGRQPIVTNNSIDFGLSLLQDVREQSHSYEE